MEQRWKAMNWKEVYNRGIINEGNAFRIHRVMNRAIHGENVKVAFIGGSITAGAAATTPETCYAYLVYSWWRERFPNSRVEYINAGIGATTSKFGVARVEDDVLKYQSDIVFVEFSVNDSENELFQETFEGLIRKILLDPKEPAVFMFNNAFYDDGRNAQRIHNEVGRYYDIPIVSIKESIYTVIEAGTICATDISADNLHPNDFGHELVAGVITNLLEKLLDKTTDMRNENNYIVPMQPLTKNRYYHSFRYNNLNTKPVLHGFVEDKEVKIDVWDVFREGWSGSEVGSSICFEVEGTIISVQYRKYAVHPAPVAKLVIDREEEKTVILDANFDETWGDCLYLQDIRVDLAPGKHVVEITIMDEVPEKAFYLASVITA